MTTPFGFAPVFAGWNVWDVYQADDPSFSVWELGESPARRLQVWVENAASSATGAAVSDPVNPLALRGDQVQIVPSPSGLTIAATREDIPGLAGQQQVGPKGTTASLHTVRFFNRGTDTSLPWPHEEEFLLNVVYQPTTSNPLTSAPAPGSLAGAASSAGDSLAQVAKVASYGIGAFVVLKLIQLFGGK